jgi:hypothetical protein
MEAGIESLDPGRLVGTNLVHLIRTQNGLLANMDIRAWVKRADLSSPITERAVLLVGRDGVLPTKAIGSGVFIADRLVMTAKHVVEGYWDTFNKSRVRMEQPGKKMADFEMFAIQAPGDSAETAQWAASKISICPYSDLALISVVPVDDLAKAQPPLGSLRMSILPPTKGEKITAFGYASTSVVDENGQQMTFQLNPSISIGTVTEVFPEKRDSCNLPFPSYEIQGHFIGGMSGGPIFNETGELCGLICSGLDDASVEYSDEPPVAWGAVLWPMVGIRIDHRIPGVISPPPYTILELARAGLMDVWGWQYVEANVEPYEDADGTKKIRLKE